MTPSGRRLQNSVLEKYLAGALGAESRARIETILAESPADQAELADLRAETTAFLLRHPPGPLVAHFERKHERQRGRGLTLLLVFLLVAMAVFGLHARCCTPMFVARL